MTVDIINLSVFGSVSHKNPLVLGSKNPLNIGAKLGDLDIIDSRESSKHKKYVHLNVTRVYATVKFKIQLKINVVLSIHSNFALNLHVSSKATTLTINQK